MLRHNLEPNAPGVQSLREALAQEIEKSREGLERLEKSPEHYAVLRGRVKALREVLQSLEAERAEDS